MSNTKTKQKKEINISHTNFKLAFERFLRHKMKHPNFGIVTKELDRQIKKFKVYFNESDYIYRYNNAFMIGLNSPYVKKGSKDNAYHNIRVKLAEQIGLTRCSNRIQLQRFAINKQTKYSSRLSEYIKDLFFILEMLRTNSIMKGIDNYLNFNLKYVAETEMRYLGVEINKQIETAKQFGPISNVGKLMIIRDVLRFMSASVLTENPIVLDVKDEELNKITHALFPLALYAPDASNTQTVINMTEKLLEMIDHILIEAKIELQDAEEKMKTIFGFKEIGSYDPLYEAQGGNHQTDEEFKDKMADMFDDEKTKKGHKVKEEIDASAKKNDEEDYIDFVEEEEFKDYGEEKEIKDIAKTMDQGGPDTGETNPYERQYRPSVTARMAEEYFNGSKKSRHQQKQERDEDLQVKGLHVEITTALHKGCQAFFKERNKMSTFADYEYKEIVEVMKPFINQIVRSLKALIQQAQIQSNEYEQMGTLDSSKLVDYKAFGDTNIFKNHEIEIMQMLLEVMILVDNSGSQGQEVWNPKNNVHEPRYKFNQMYTIMLHEVFKKLGFPHSVWTFYESSRSKQQMSNIIHRENCFHEDSGLYINEIGAHGGNRDGFAIRYAGHYLNRSSRTKNRLLIVISDGQPAGDGYHGHEAMQDVYDATKEVEAGGATVIGIFTGSERENEYFKKMYDKPVFANNDSITTLPEKFKKILIEQYRSKVNAQI